MKLSPAIDMPNQSGRSRVREFSYHVESPDDSENATNQQLRTQIPDPTGLETAL